MPVKSGQEGATRQWAVMSVPKRRNEAKRQRGKWRKPDLSAKRLFALREWLL
ncbi:MAG: hypothetical protein ACLTFL_17695 [Bacteroides thetaiotaomicron]